MANILKHGVGQLNDVIDLKGIRRIREDKLLTNIGEDTHLVDVVYDPDHFLFQNLMPITKQEYQMYQTQGKQIPRERFGPVIVCTCGAAGGVILDNRAPLEWQNKLICTNVAQFGIHQTDMEIKDGKMKLPKKLEQDFIMTQDEVLRTLKNEGE